MPSDHDAEVTAALVLQQQDGLNPTELLTLYRGFGSFAAVLDAEPGTLRPLLSGKAWRGFVAHRNAPRMLTDRSQEILGLCRSQGIELLPLGDQRYPPLLQEIDRPPPLLFLKGDPALLSMPQVAVVGSRNATAGGRENAYNFARALAASGFVVTSGLALGIDSAAHRGALVGGKTIAVTGCGVDVVYPRSHLDLYQRIVADGGVVVSEFLPATPPRPHNFPRRNRIISGLSMGVLVIEATLKSGSLITARCATEQGREVFAIPGSIHNAASKGCHQLLRQGATLVETAADIVEQLGGMLAYLDQCCGIAAADEESELLQAIGFDPVDVDSLVDRVGKDIAALNQELVELELAGKIEMRAGKVVRVG